MRGKYLSMEDSFVDDILKSIFSEEDFNIENAFKQKLKQYDISKTKVLRLLSIDKNVFDDIISGTAKQPNLIHVVKLADFLDIELNRFIKIVLKNQSKENIAALDRARKTSFILRNADVRCLTILGFFEAKDDVNQLIEKILLFFGYDSIQEYEEKLEESLYSRFTRNPSDRMRDFWIKTAYQRFRVIANPNAYNIGKLSDLMVKLKPYTQDISEGLFTVCKALYNIGITVIFQDHISNDPIRSGTFIINNKPCIVITDYSKSYPIKWFALLHELYHILYDYDVLERNRIHLSGDDDLLLLEEKANDFALDYFLPIEDYNQIKGFMKNHKKINAFAEKNEIHPSLVHIFSRMHLNKLDGEKLHGYYDMFTYQEAIRKLYPISWKNSDIKSNSERIKKAFESKK